MMVKKELYFVIMLRNFSYILFLMAVQVHADNLYSQATISGLVTDSNKNPVIGANVYLQGTYDGSSTDVTGRFTFSTTKTGIVTLVASFIGYAEFSKEIELSATGFDINIVMKESINKMDAVVITAGSFVAADESRKEVMRPLDIVTTAGATADIPGALNTLPGTQTVGEEGRLFVRGGDSYETTTYIDGMIVLDSYDPTVPGVPARNRFSPMMFKGVSFSTGGYSAEYGSGLSSALILNAKDMATLDRTDLSLMSVGLEAAHTKVWNNSSLSGKLAYINLEPYYNLVKQNIDWASPSVSQDGNIAYRFKTSRTGLLKIYGNFKFSDMTLNYVPVDSTGNITTRIRNQYGYITGSYKEVLSDSWTMKTGISYTYSNDDITPDNDIINERIDGYHVKAVFGHDFSDAIVLNFGAEMIKRNHFQDFTDFESGYHNRYAFSDPVASSFAEAEIYISEKFLTRIGLRSAYHHLNHKITIDPRISLAYQTGKKSQVSLAYGKFRQSAPDGFLRVANNLLPEKATHYIVNYQISDNGRTFRAEAYIKNYQELVKFTNPFDPVSYNNSGSGLARGIDIFWRDNKTIRNTDYWVSYSFLDTKRDYKDFPYEAPPYFASAHNFSVVFKHFVSSIKSQIGATWSYTSGRPYNNPNQDLFNEGKTKPYYDLSVNISYLARQNLIVYASVTNVFGRENIFGYEYKSTPDNQGIYLGRPVVLAAPRFLFLGIFLTLSKDSVMNQLPYL